jgi:hypothetical protein
MSSERLVALLGFLFATLLIASLWLFTTYNPEPERSARKSGTAHAKALARETLSPSAVLLIDVSRPSVMRSAPVNAPAVATLAHEYDTARNLRPLYLRLTGPGAPATPDAKYVLYEILASCASRTDRKVATQGAGPGVLDRRKLAESIPDSNPDKQKRLQAFDDLHARCEGMEGVSTSRAELERLLKDAASGGDPAARATLIAREMFDPDVPTRGDGKITDAQAQALREIVGSRDPDAILRAGTILSNTFDDMVLEVGPNHEQIDNRAEIEAWRLVACEYGMECGAASRDLSAACAYQGQCGAGSVPDLVFFYRASPNEAQLIEQYRQVFRQAVESNDWSQVRFARRPNTSGTRFGFSTYP